MFNVPKLDDEEIENFMEYAESQGDSNLSSWYSGTDEGLYSLKGFFLVVGQGEKEGLYDMILLAGKAIVYKQICEVAFNNVKNCYTTDAINENLVNMVKAYVIEEFRKRLSTY